MLNMSGLKNIKPLSDNPRDFIFRAEEELHDYLLSPASKLGLSSTAEYIQTLAQANEIRKYSHGIISTHGDFNAHNFSSEMMAIYRLFLIRSLLAGILNTWIS
jgi:hypothetical protein